jgi:hypothetical protein
MIRFINLDSYKDRSLIFQDFYECIEFYARLILDDYETDKIEVETLIPFTNFNDDFKLTEMPKNRWMNGVDIGFISSTITNKGISIHCKINKNAVEPGKRPYG